MDRLEIVIVIFSISLVVAGCALAMVAGKLAEINATLLKISDKNERMARMLYHDWTARNEKRGKK